MVDKLVVIIGSPFSERAMFGLEVGGVRVKRDALWKYSPLDEDKLRKAMQTPAGEVVSVPVLKLSSGEWIKGSIAIAQWGLNKSPNAANMQSSSELLGKVDAATDKLLRAGRYRAFTRVAEKHAYDLKDFPPLLRWLLPPFLKGILVSSIFTKTANKYKGSLTLDSALVDQREALAELERLRGGRDYFEGDHFTLVDAVVAGSLGFIAKCPAPRSQQGPNIAKYFYEVELAKEFSALLTWRDQIYAKHSNGKLPLE